MNGSTSLDGGLNRARAVYLVARREFQTRVRGKVFVIGTAVSIGLIGLYAVLQITVFNNINTTTSFHVGFSPEVGSLAAPVRAAGPSLDVEVTVTQVGDPASAEAQVRDGTLDALVTGSPGAAQVVVRSQLNPTLASLITGVLRQQALDAQLSQAGLDPAAVAAQANRATYHLDVLQPTKPNAYEQPVVGMVVAFLLFLFLSIYGGVLAQGVVAEKASRVVEVVLATLRPGQLLLGKVSGIGLVGLLQFGIIAAAGLALTLPTHLLTLPGAAVGSVLSGVLWFVLGFVLYGLLVAMSAATVSRTEEVSAATIPVTLLMTLGWLLAYLVFIPEITAATEGTVVPPGVENLGTVASLVPFFSPILMPIRIAAGDAPLWQGMLAILLTLISIAGATWLGARVYANSVLRFGARVRLRDALRRTG
jgi:ABC-2 type transport system permease protein